ncbi:hypothetical protein SDC9_148371 [bioreactor metagenome]|uniref:Uncharacterized protein n=1 Tax=bioreactor metagenome TaxID=1076179 RepID=A0A645EGL5_9ZZZZ
MTGRIEFSFSQGFQYRRTKIGRLCVQPCQIPSPDIPDIKTVAMDQARSKHDGHLTVICDHPWITDIPFLGIHLQDTLGKFLHNVCLHVEFRLRTKSITDEQAQ